MKQFALIIALLILGFSSFAQQYSYDFLADKYCTELEKSDFTNKTPEEINYTFFNAGNEIRKTYADTISKIGALIRHNNDTITDSQIAYQFTNQYLITMINNCKYYLAVNRLLIDSCPAENKSLQYIGLKVNQYFALNPQLNADEIQKQSLKIIGDALMDIHDQIEADYSEGLSNPQLITDIRVYLLHKSDTYLKAWLINQSKHLYKAQNQTK